MITASPLILTLHFNQTRCVARGLTAVDNLHLCHGHSQVQPPSIFSAFFSLTSFHCIFWPRTVLNRGCNICKVDEEYCSLMFALLSAVFRL